MAWHRAHRGRLTTCYFFVAGWTIVSWNSLDGVHVDDVSEFSALRLTSAWFVALGGVTILTDLFYRLPYWVLMVGWGFFGSGLTFWAVVATSGWPLFAMSACAGWWQVWDLAGRRHKVKVVRRELV